MTLCFLREDPFQAKLKITEKSRITKLRTNMREHLEDYRLSGLGETVDMMHPIVQRWAHPIYQDHVSKTFSADNLRDFVRYERTSNLVMPARLLVHAFIWITTPGYRDTWGPFDPMNTDGNGPPASSPSAPGSVPLTS